MEKELEKIKKEVLEFCQEYQCSIEINTEFYRRTSDGTIVPDYVTIKINQ